MTLSLTFLGAADTVTGSRTLVTYRGQRWLIDCGLFQGNKEQRQRNWRPLEPAAERITGVILTHAHLDHSGYLPRLVRQGFGGRIHATHGTADLARLLLLDAAYLEEEQAEFANRSGYSHHRPALPLFTTEDAEKALTHFERHERHEWFALAPGLSCRFLRAGHIVGASLVQLQVETPKGPRTVTFSGDLGNDRAHVLRGPEILRETDALVLESTYGQRLQPRSDSLSTLEGIATRTFARGGVLVIPAFAIGRSQEIIYMLRQLEDQRRIPIVPIILDSPMSANALEVCLRHSEDHILDSAFLMQENREDAFRPRLFEVSTTPDESMLTCMREGPLVVVSASGMLSGGRILHHLKHRLPDRRHTVLFSGYQAEGTKGRWLQQLAAGEVSGPFRIHHQEVEVAAEIVTMEELSAHADWADLLGWLGGLHQRPETIVLNHGEKAAQQAMRGHIEERFGWRALLASEQTELELW